MDKAEELLNTLDVNDENLYPVWDLYLHRQQ